MEYGGILDVDDATHGAVEDTLVREDSSSREVVGDVLIEEDSAGMYVILAVNSCVALRNILATEDNGVGVGQNRSDETIVAEGYGVHMVANKCDRVASIDGKIVREETEQLPGTGGIPRIGTIHAPVLGGDYGVSRAQQSEEGNNGGEEESCGLAVCHGGLR